jgi:hypothetical protein
MLGTLVPITTRQSRAKHDKELPMTGIRPVAVGVLTFVALLAPGILGTVAAPALAQEATARVVGPVRLHGLYFEIGEHVAQVMGALHGTLFVESGTNALDGWSVLCPATFVISGPTPSFNAEGYCAIARDETQKIYARWTCAGTVHQGCRGRLTMTGGIGSFARITGESDVIVRGTMLEITDVPPTGPRGPIGVAREIGTGLMILPNLRYRVP